MKRKEKSAKPKEKFTNLKENFTKSKEKFTKSKEKKSQKPKGNQQGSKRSIRTSSSGKQKGLKKSDVSRQPIFKNKLLKN